MFTRLNFIARSAAITAIAAAMATPAAAQNSQTDARWQAWIGCWTPAGTLIRVVGRAAPSLVCVVPGGTATSVDIITVSAGKIADRMHVDTDGQPHAIAKEGCSGWQSAKWSPSARRVYLKSEFNCTGAPVTKLSALYAMAGFGDWIDVQGMRVDKNSAVHSVRYRETRDLSGVPVEITQRIPERAMAKAAAKLAVTEQPSIAEVEEASAELDPSVVSTWLIEADKLNIERPVPLTGKQLVQLADHGVSGSVIDVMMGLSYPDMLSISPVNGVVARQNADSVLGLYGVLPMGPSAGTLIGFDRWGFPIYVTDVTMMYGCVQPWLYGPYDGGWNIYAAHYLCGGYGTGGGYVGFPGYGYGGALYDPGYYGRYYGGGYGGGPVVTPKGNGEHGKVVNGKGYSEGTGSSGTTATPRSDASSGSSGSSSSSSPPPPARTAQPKKP